MLTRSNDSLPVTAKNEQSSGGAAAADARASLAAPVAPVVTASSGREGVTDTAAKPETDAVATAVNSLRLSGAAPETVLADLDARRVELENRRAALDRREAELQGQFSALNERLAELRGLTNRLSEVRKERDAQHETRMEQLANVYGAMAPAEAAPLIAKMEDGIALGLLERMAGKRMGQVLAVMDKDRAIELTKLLSDTSGR